MRRSVGSTVGRSDRRWSVGRTVGRSNGRSDGRMGGRTDGQSDARPDGWTIGRSVGQTVGRSVGRTVGQTGGISLALIPSPCSRISKEKYGHKIEALTWPRSLTYTANALNTASAELSLGRDDAPSPHFAWLRGFYLDWVNPYFLVSMNCHCRKARRTAQTGYLQTLIPITSCKNLNN